MKLRDYQRRSLDQLYQWFHSNENGNPCLVMPTGSGKSWIIAALCHETLGQWPDQRILMLTHQKELIEQNAEKLRLVWPGAPMGIYSASVGQRELSEPITFAGIQSVRSKAELIGHVDIIVIDECHLINNTHAGSYRTLISDLQAKNPHIRIIGLTASPWRLGQGSLTDGDDALFHDLIEPVSIEELIHKGYLSKLVSKATELSVDVTGVKKRGGEYVEKDLQEAVDKPMLTSKAVEESIRKAGDRSSWLFFCVGVAHAEHVAACLFSRGISARCITGETPKKEREEILSDFKAGKIQALTNANVLTTGFDAPNIDMVVMLRPTMSPTLYCQMVGRGMRPKDHTDHCLFLDFVGAVMTHGPITNIRPPSKKGDKPGDAPVKECPECHSLIHLSVMKCPDCGYDFPPPVKTYQLYNDDIMGQENTRKMVVQDWQWMTHTGRNSGIEMLKTTYYGALDDPPITEYFTVTHDGYAGQKARVKLGNIAKEAGIFEQSVSQGNLMELAQILNSGKPPTAIEYEKNGRFYNVRQRLWE